MCQLLGAQRAYHWVVFVPAVGCKWFLSLLAVPDAGCQWRPSDLSVAALRLAFGMVNHEDAKQTEYALKIIRAHCIDVLSLFCEKDWHM